MRGLSEQNSGTKGGGTVVNRSSRVKIEFQASSPDLARSPIKESAFGALNSLTPDASSL